MEPTWTKLSWIIAVAIYIVIICTHSTMAVGGLQGMKSYWGHWGPWSSCSRTCGGGVSEQTRKCLRQRGNGRSMYISNHCVGLYKRYKMCNKKKCPGDNRRFREEQCDMYNTRPLMNRLYTWEALIRESKPCELHCRAKGQTFFAKLADKVIDGTRCRNDSDIDICVDGMCKRVGCDGVLGSGLVVDKCGVCGGSNTDCHITREIFNRLDLDVGYHAIATIPEGAMYINITEMSPSRNYLALQSSSGNPYINGNWHIDYPGNFTVAGTVFQYKRSSRTLEGEEIIATGPTTEALEILMIYQQANPGIYYEFTIPRHKPSDERGLGGGIYLEEVDYYSSSYSDYETNIDKDAVPNIPVNTPESPHEPRLGSLPVVVNDQPIVSSTRTGQDNFEPINSNRYDQSGPPEPNIRTYNTYDASSSSSVPGGIPYDTPGVHRPVYPPVQPKGGSDLHPGYRPQPVVNNFNGFRGGPEFPRRVVQPTYQTGPTEQYDPPPENQAIREGEGAVQVFESSSTSEGTEGTNSAMYFWMETKVTGCTHSCAGGIQQSMSQCVNHITSSPVDDSMCVMDYKPNTKTMACNTQPCPPIWTTGEWTECSATCGTSHRQRQVLCKEQRTQSVITTVQMDNCNQTTTPQAVEDCNTPECPFWQTGTWGECSVDCGEGQKEREVVCINNGIRTSADHCAEQRKPATSHACEMGSCVPEWIYSPYSESCSAECGAGYKSRNVICSTAGSAGAISQEVCSDIQKPRASKVCSKSSCGAKWVMSAWTQCSSECGPGSESRLVLCISTVNVNRVVEDSQCRGDKPAAVQTCQVAECGSLWYKSDFSQCSRSCGGGVITRTVKCLDEAFEPSTNCSEEDQPSVTDNCNPQDCISNEPPTDCRDKFSYCDKVARSRLCSYSYYGKHCCFSCYSQINNR